MFKQNINISKNIKLVVFRYKKPPSLHHIPHFSLRQKTSQNNHVELIIIHVIWVQKLIYKAEHTFSRPIKTLENFESRFECTPLNFSLSCWLFGGSFCICFTTFCYLQRFTESLLWRLVLEIPARSWVYHHPSFNRSSKRNYLKCLFEINRNFRLFLLTFVQVCDSFNAACVVNLKLVFTD